ncbi:MAG: hypothetical protein ACR2HR_02115 [Euzebya sp.]
MLTAIDVSLPNATAVAVAPDGTPAVLFVNSLFSADGLTLVDCNDPLCAGGDESTVILTDANPNYTDLAIDAAGNPVIVYSSSNSVFVIHCDDSSCAGTEDPTTLQDDTVRNKRAVAAEVAADNPIVTFYDDPLATGLTAGTRHS